MKQIKKCESDQRAHPHPQPHLEEKHRSENHFCHKRRMPKNTRQRGRTDRLPRPLWGTASQSTIETAKGEWNAYSESEGNLDGARQRCLQGKGKQERCRVNFLEPTPKHIKDNMVQSSFREMETAEIESDPQESPREETGYKIGGVGGRTEYVVNEKIREPSKVPLCRENMREILSHRFMSRGRIEFLVHWVENEDSELIWERGHVLINTNIRASRKYIKDFGL